MIDVVRRKRTISYSSLDQGGRIYGLPRYFSSIADIDGISFYDLVNSHEAYLLKELRLLHEISTEDLLIQHLIPWAVSMTNTSTCDQKKVLVDWIFSNSRSPGNKLRTLITTSPIVPLPMVGTTCQYGCLIDMVDPKSRYAKLFFAEENRFPCPHFLRKHRLTLEACGLGDGTTSFTIFERAQYYAQSTADPEVLTEKVKCLLKVPLVSQGDVIQGSTIEFRNLKWIPGTSIEGRSALFSPNACRGVDQKHLVDLVLGTTVFSASSEWKILLGRSVQKSGGSS